MEGRQDNERGWVAWFGVLLLLGGNGCVERRLTVNTRPQGAVIILNDEEIGESPVITSFKWYGDFTVQARKPGFETLRTHRALEAPWYDRFPFDFFAQILNPHHIVDAYEWTFELPPQSVKDREALVSEALQLKQQLERKHEPLP